MHDLRFLYLLVIELIMQGLDRLDAARVAYNKACKNLMNFMFQES